MTLNRREDQGEIGPFKPLSLLPRNAWQLLNSRFPWSNCAAWGSAWEQGRG